MKKIIKPLGIGPGNCPRCWKEKSGQHSTIFHWCPVCEKVKDILDSRAAIRLADRIEREARFEAEISSIYESLFKKE